MTFERATRRASRLRIGLESPSGGGKTWTALKIASELAKHDGGRVAVIDSERGSASKYSDGRPFDFDHAVLRTPPAPGDYIDALQAAAEAKYPVVVIDSASHEWKGVLAIVDRATTANFSGNSWSAWSRGRPAHDAFVDAMLAMPAHIVATFRSKQESEQYQDGGKTKVRKLGLAPVSSEDIDYEFDVWGSISHDEHTVIISKSRIDTIPVGSEWPGGAGLVDAYLAWLGGAEYETPPAPAPATQQREELPRRAPAGRSSAPRADRAESRPSASGEPRNAGELLTWALNEHGLGRGQVCEMLGVAMPSAIEDFAGAQRTIAEKLGLPPAVDVQA